ncbi:hypothetical protein BU090_09185 [Staphylococcus warneri]|uniref:hypothetical protein n=1 Tax=Staphylococcus warneri TaxID=1292 RepID=UPI000D1D3229|nr:hypothetical protein [Staphylococcus warneri]PTI59903.1 hypothetical protein BU090_09185 [Staphylococcus warneri]
MSLIKECIINNKIIEYTLDNTENDEKQYIIYNNYNNRTIIANEEVINYLRNNNSIDSTSPLYNFIEGNKKFSLLEIHIVNILINTKYINQIQKFAKITTNNYISILALLFTIITISLKSNDIMKFKDFDFHNIPYLVITMYLSQFIIVLLHELSHYYYYNNFFHPKYIRFGITLRYIVMVLFFTSVPFIDVMNKKDKKKLITAGIKTQITLQGFLSFCLLFTINNDFIITIFLLNIGIIIINILPFFKLDGYWYLNAILNIKDYMLYYKNMILLKERFNFFIFLIGTINVILIISIIIYSFFSIYKTFT